MALPGIFGTLAAWHRGGLAAWRPGGVAARSIPARPGFKVGLHLVGTESSAVRAHGARHAQRDVKLSECRDENAGQRMANRPSLEEMRSLGLYDPAAPDATDQLRLLEKAFELGASLDEVRGVVEAGAGAGGLSSLLLDLAMRPPGRTDDLDSFAVDSGLDPALVHRIWLALGFPDSLTSPIRVTPDAAEALRFMAEMVGWLGEEVMLGVARVLGSSMASLSEAVSSAFRVGIEVPKRNSGIARYQVVEDTTSAVQDLLPPFLRAADAVFRRHLVNVSYQLWSTDAEQAAVTLQRTVCFADLVGSTEALRARLLGAWPISSAASGSKCGTWSAWPAAGS